MRLMVSCAAFMLAGGALASGVQESQQASQVERFLGTEDTPLVSYRAVRYLEAASRGGKAKATLTAMTSLDPNRGFDFEILEETGSDTIRSRVLRAALEAERRARTSGEAAQSALTRTNYEFGPAEVSEPGFVRVGIRPRHGGAMLVDGSILLTEDHAELVRIEGRLLKRPSFWTRRVELVRHYARLAGVRVPVSLESTADVLLAGRSTFSMRYEYETINEQPVMTTASLRH
jgi:hypothetical protein